MPNHANHAAVAPDAKDVSQPAPQQSAPASATVDVRALYQILRRNAVIILGVLALTIAMGLLVTLLTEPTYKATASIEIDQESQRILASQDVQTSSYADADRFLQTQTEVLLSRAMGLRVAQALDLVGNSTFFAQMGEEAPASFGSSTRTAEQRRATVGLLLRNLEVTLPQDSRVADITFYSPDAALAARIANAYASQFIRYNLERKFQTSDYARSFLSKQLAATKGRLEASERALNNYARQAGIIKTGDTAASQSILTSSLVQMNQAANNAEADRIQAEEKWKSAARTPLMSIPEVLSNSAVQNLLQQRAQREAELSNLLALHREEYPTVKNLRAQVSELDEQIATLANSIKTSIRDRYVAAREQEGSIKTQVNALKGESLAEQDRGVQYNILAREADTNRTLYEGLLQRYKEVSAESGITSNNISVIDQAQTPSAPSSPNLILNLAIAVLGGLAIAAGLVFIREQVDDVVREPTDVESKLGLPLLGVVPRVGADEIPEEQLRLPRSTLSEAYHALRTSLMHSTPTGLPRTMVVTSSRASEGKSTTSFALAFDLARLGLKVALIDTDLRRPSLHRTLKVKNEVGLSTLLTHNCTLEDAMRPVGEEDAPIRFVSAGPIPPSPTELLASRGMTELLAQLSDQFDVVVLDGPPVLGLADAPILAVLADATLLVVEANNGSRGATKSAIRRLQAAHANVLGAILTKFDPRKSSASSYYEYEYYHYGQDD